MVLKSSYNIRIDETACTVEMQAQIMQSVPKRMRILVILIQIKLCKICLECLRLCAVVIGLFSLLIFCHGTQHNI